jgi:hypothetical protein
MGHRSDPGPAASSSRPPIRLVLLSLHARARVPAATSKCVWPAVWRDQIGYGGHERAGGGGAVLGGARGVPSGGAGQLPQRLQRRLQRLARRLPALLRQRMHGRSRSVHRQPTRMFYLYTYTYTYIYIYNEFILMNVIRDFNLEHDSGRTSKGPSICTCTCTCATGWRRVRAQGAQAIISGPWGRRCTHKLIHHNTYVSS